MLRTVCRDCAFAVYNKDTQTGCALGKLDKFRSVGVQLVEAYDETGKEFYVIEDMFCSWTRPQAWIDAHKDDDLVEVLKQELRIPYQAIIRKTNDLEALGVTLRSLNAQTLKPKNVVVVRGHDGTTRLPDIMRVLTDSLTNIKWNIQAETDEQSRLDDVLVHSEYPFFGIFNAGFEVPSWLFEDLNSKIYDDLFRFAFLLPNSAGNGLIGQTQIYKTLGLQVEHSDKLLGEPICKNLIFKTTEIFPSFPE